MGKKTIAIFLLCHTACHVSVAQQISTKGKFLQDSVMVGEAIPYSLSVKYPLSRQVIFPDSLYRFTPFEFQEKQYFTTRIDSTHAYDSVVYTLTTFDIEPIQKLQLPIYVLEGSDSVAVFSNPDSVYLKTLVSVVPDSLVLKENLAFQHVPYTFNYPYFTVGVGIFLIFIVGFYVVCGKAIRKKIKRYQLKKAYVKFTLSFERGINNIKTQQTAIQPIEETLVIWKKYMEKLENKPYTKYTSKEILKLGHEKALQNTLQSIDLALYGAHESTSVRGYFEQLEDFTLERYQLKLKAIQNG